MMSRAGKWHTRYIAYLEKYDIINGYENGTFRADNKITHAEVVTILNRVTECNADMDFIEAHVLQLLSFSGVKDKGYWLYADVVETSNTHEAFVFDDTES